MKLDQPHPSKNLSKNCCLPGCIEGARLQLCRKKPGMTRAIASEGCSLVQVSIQILVFLQVPSVEAAPQVDALPLRIPSGASVELVPGVGCPWSLALWDQGKHKTHASE